MKSQDYKNHTRIHPVYHYVLSLLVLVTLVAAITNMVLAINEGTNILQAVILVLIMMMIIIVVALVRTYALKAQDRAIRAEESLRYYSADRRVARSRTQYGANCRVTVCWRQ